MLQSIGSLISACFTHCSPCGCVTPAIQVYYTVYIMSLQAQFTANKYLEEIAETSIGTRTDTLFCEENIKEVILSKFSKCGEQAEKCHIWAFILCSLLRFL